MQAKRITCALVSLIFMVLRSSAQDRLTSTSPGTAYGEGSQMKTNYGSVPLIFEANQGQMDSRVRFLSRGSGYSAFLTAGGIVLALRLSEADFPEDKSKTPVPTHRFGTSHFGRLEKHPRTGKSAVVAIDLVGGAASPAIIGENPLSTKVNYFIGRDPSKWRRNVPTYSKIRYRNVYPGIDLVYYGNGRRVEYDFDLAPGADATQIQLAVKGVDALSIDSAGNLVLSKGASKLWFETPILYQKVNGVRARVSGTYVLRGGTLVGFEVGRYDATKPLVIDPVLVYSTFLGGSSDDLGGGGIAVDSTGAAYVVGYTDSSDFPLASIGSYNSTQFRMFLTKLDPSGSTLLFADYFGGTSGGDEPSAIALDSSGNAYVTGCATSSDFPVLSAYQSTLSGSQDAFLTKFSADGSSIIYSTYLGGSALTYIGGSTSQYGNAVSVDPAGEAVIAGMTMATDFPAVNAYQSSVSTDQSGVWGAYGFLTKFAAGGASLVYSTYLAGSTIETSSCLGVCFPDSEILGVVTDASGNAYVTGYTMTTDFPVTSGAFMTTYPGLSSDVGFVSKFTGSGAIAYSTYLGGQNSSVLNAIAVDASGSAYVTGWDPAGDNFPIVTTSICDPSVSACNGAVVAKLDPAGANLIYSTFLGTSNNMTGTAIQVDANGDAFIGGSDVAFDLANPIEQYAGGGSDVVVAEVDPSASTLLMATFLGGQGWEAGAGLALDSTGAVYVSGDTQSFDFPVTPGAFQTTWGGQTDTFISKIDPNTSAPAVTMTPYSLQFGSENIGSISAPQTTLLRNMGSATLTLSEVIGADFAETDDCDGTVAAALFCTFTVTFAPTTSGNLMEALTLTDNAQSGTQSIDLTGTGTGSGPDFTVVARNDQAAVSPGGTATYKLSVTPIGGSFSSVVNFACDGAPAFAICSVTPQSVIPGTDSSTIIVTVRTANTRKILQPPSSGTTPPGVYNLSLVASSGPLRLVAALKLIVLKWGSRRWLPE